MAFKDSLVIFINTMKCNDWLVNTVAENKGIYRFSNEFLSNMQPIIHRVQLNFPGKFTGVKLPQPSFKNNPENKKELVEKKSVQLVIIGSDSQTFYLY